jgi:hypothetical protein
MKVHNNLLDAVHSYAAHVRETRIRRIILAVISALFIIGAFAKCSDEPVERKKYVSGIIAEPDPEEPTGYDPPVMAFVEPGRIQFFDGTETYIWGIGSRTIRAGSKTYTIDDTVYTLNDDGTMASTTLIGYTPEFIRMETGNIWTARYVTPVEADEAGRLPKDYVEFKKNSVMYGQWVQYRPAALAVIGSDVFCRSTVGKWYHVNGVINPYHVQENGLLVTDVNTTTKTGKINGVDVSWILNYFNGTKEWNLIDSVWYSENGYKFDGVLTEYDSEMKIWRQGPFLTGYTEAPTMLSVGGQYWIECNSGYLVRFNHIANTVTLSARLYSGDGLKATGIAKKSSLFPALINGSIYFKTGNDFYKHDTITGLTTHFISGVSQVTGY